MSNSDPTLFERLAKVEPAKLARLLVELAAQDQTILEQVQFLLASGDTTAIAKAVRSTLRAWKRSPRFIHYQEAFAFGEQLDRLLDSVEDGLLGPDPALDLGARGRFGRLHRHVLPARLPIVRPRRAGGGFARRPGRTDRPPCGKGRLRGAPQPAGARPPIFGQRNDCPAGGSLEKASGSRAGFAA